MATELYESYCRKNNILLDTKLLTALTRSGITGELTLGGMTISAASCEALSYVISTNQSISRIDLSNCLLPATELCIIFDGLLHSSVNYLNLKGNNIFGPVTARLSRILSKNTSLKSLVLEWNNIGTPVISFSQFCNALLNNVSLEYLDLRNNALNTECSIELADVISRSTRLKEIDLRWNNFGTEGGQHLLKALHSNKTLQELKVQGSSIPSDIVIAIDEIVKSNCTIQTVKSEYAARHEMLTKQIQNINQTRVDEMKLLCEQSTHQLQPVLNKLKEYANEKKVLVQQLEEAKLYAVKLEEDLECVQSQMEEMSLKIGKSETVVANKDKEIISVKEEIEKEKVSIKNKYTEQENKLKEEVRNVEAALEMEKIAKDKLEVLLAESRNEVEYFREEVSSLRSKLQSEASAHNKFIDEERNLHQETICKLLEEIKQQQTRARKMADEIQGECNERIEQLENKLKDAELSKAEATAELTSAKAKWIEERPLIAAEATEKQMSKVTALAELLEKNTQEKQKLEQELADARSKITEVEKEYNSLKFEQKELMSKLSQVFEKLSDEKTAIQELKTELCETKCSNNVLQQECLKHKSELAIAQQQVNDLRHRLDMLAAEHKREIENLNSKLNAKSEEVSTMRASELERARTLCSAIQQYVGGS